MLRKFGFLPALFGFGCLVVGFRAPVATSGGAGLALWRKPDKAGRACASCHSADGIEIARYNFDETDIIRRATPHLGESDAREIAKYILDLRASLPDKRLKDPMVDRPMQPGGEALAGKSAAERDRAFALGIDKYFPALMGGRIGSLDQAKKAEAEVLACDPRALPVGIELNRLSEDKFHGKEHATLAHWIPDEPPIVMSPEFVEAEDRYLAAPTDENLASLQEFYDKAWKAALPPIRALSLEKARALLLYQHYLRTGKLPDIPKRAPDARIAPSNPFWDLGDMARVYENMTAGGLDLPPDLAANKSGGPSLSAQLAQMRLPWLWLGWTYDPSLQLTSYDRRTRFADWFSEILLEDGPYPMHDLVMLTKKQVDEAYRHGSWASATPQHLVLNFSWILRDKNWRTYAPSDPKHRAAFNHFMANAFRMFALLQADELRHTGKTYMREPLVQQLSYMKEAVNTVDRASTAQDEPIFEDALQQVARATLIIN